MVFWYGYITELIKQQRKFPFDDTEQIFGSEKKLKYRKHLRCLLFDWIYKTLANHTTIFKHENHSFNDYLQLKFNDFKNISWFDRLKLNRRFFFFISILVLYIHFSLAICFTRNHYLLLFLIWISKKIISLQYSWCVFNWTLEWTFNMRIYQHIRIRLWIWLMIICDSYENWM